jgi:hypothetical protein
MARRKRTPLDALDNAIGRALILDRYSRHNRGTRPGQVILEMPAEDRELLKKLTSEELCKRRVDAHWLL